MWLIVAAILIALLIQRCVDASGLSEIGKILAILLIIIVIILFAVGVPEANHYFTLR